MEVTVLHISLWIASVFPQGLGCPVLCTCSERFSHFSADCAYRNFTAVPDGLPSNVMTLSLSANMITLVPSGTFDHVTELTSLWMAHNEIVTIEQGALSPLVHLRNFDISYNKIIDFPWEDLRNLTALQLLKMNHNEMSHLPKDAFANLKDLRSLRLNNNRFTTIADGTFEGLVSLTHLQIYKNPFACTCFLDWFREWISTTTVSVPEQDEIRCSSLGKNKGAIIGQINESLCTSPKVVTKPEISKTTLQEGSLLVLTCKFTGNPKPLIIRSIQSRNPEELREDPLLSDTSVQVFSNWNLIISHFKENDSGNFSCSVTNEFGGGEDSVSVEVVASSKPGP